LLTLQQSATQVDVAQSIATGCEELGADFDFGHARLLDWSGHEARALMRNALRAGRDGKRRAELLSALASDVATINGTVMCTPLCLLFGQGNQFFLERLSQAPKVGASGFASTRLKPVWSSTQIIACALFAPWRRLDRSPSFRWDPVEDRRYAFRAADPASDPLLTVSGANSLAAIGLPLITVVPVTVRGRVGARTVGVQRSAQLTQFMWPIWTRSTSLAGIRALLTHPAICNEQQLHSAQLSSLGVYELRRTARVRYGKYINFTEAEAVGLYGNCETRR